MKKILAIAVATAIAAPAMADMTISGTVTAGYVADTSDYSTANDLRAAEINASAATVAAKSESGQHGFGIDTAALTISGSETLENGLTVSGYMTVAGLARDAGVAGENAGLTIAGDFGSVAIQAIRVAGELTNVVGPADNFAGEITGESNVDLITYKAPAMGGVNAYVQFSEGTGVGQGFTTFNPAIGASMAVAEGVVVAAEYNAYQGTDANTDAKSRIRVKANADLGMAKVSLGYEDKDYEAGGTDIKTTSMGVAVPVGSSTFGASYLSQKAAGSTAISGTSVAVETALSANVSTLVRYTGWESSADQNEDKVAALVTLKF